MSLNSCLSFGGHSKDNRSIEELEGILKPYLYYLNLNFALTGSLGAPFLDWCDMAPFYAASTGRFGRDVLVSKSEHAAIEKARQLFSIALPEAIPRDERAIIKLLRSSTIKDLRRLIQDAVDGQVNLTRDWGRQAMAAALAAEMEVKRRKSLITWVVRGASLIASLALTPLVGLGVAGGLIMTEEGADAIAARSASKRYQWLYSLFDTRVKTGSKPKASRP
jgi:hypothetical protein